MAEVNLQSSVNYNGVDKNVQLVIRETAAYLRNTFADDKPDALDAVKLDPAVLEAQVTVQSKDSSLISPKYFTFENNESSPPFKGFEEMVSQQEAALLSLTPHQMDLLLGYVDMLRKQRRLAQKTLECAFCKNNGKPPFWYTSHVLKDGRGRIRCPVLRGYHCPRCGATGDVAHTIKYCPEKGTTSTDNLFN